AGQHARRSARKNPAAIQRAVSPMQWDFPQPFTLRLTVAPEEIDEYEHGNNAAYVRWLDRCAWAHSTALGISIEDCKRMDRGMAVMRSHLEYLAPAFEGDRSE